MKKYIYALQLISALLIGSASADTTTESYNYRLARGAHVQRVAGYWNPYGFVCYRTWINTKGTPYRWDQVNIEHELELHPGDAKLLAMRARAETAIVRCIREHGATHKISGDVKGSNRPVEYYVVCSLWKGGCGNSYSTCDPTGKSLPAPCPATN